jgi:hypothetical protein
VIFLIADSPYAARVWLPQAVTFPDWSLSEWLTVIGFLVGIAALIIAGVQLRQAGEQSKAAARAAEAAESAILRTESHLADVQLVSLLLQIPVIQRDLEMAVSRTQMEETIRHLGDYGRLSAEALAILERRPHASSAASVMTLRESGSLVGTAKNAIIAGESPELATRQVRDQLGVVTSEGTRIISAMKAFTDTADGDSNA